MIFDKGHGNFQCFKLPINSREMDMSVEKSGFYEAKWVAGALY